LLGAAGGGAGRGGGGASGRGLGTGRDRVADGGRRPGGGLCRAGLVRGGRGGLRRRDLGGRRILADGLGDVTARWDLDSNALRSMYFTLFRPKFTSCLAGSFSPSFPRRSFPVASTSALLASFSMM